MKLSCKAVFSVLLILPISVSAMDSGSDETLKSSNSESSAKRSHSSKRSRSSTQESPRSNVQFSDPIAELMGEQASEGSDSLETEGSRSFFSKLGKKDKKSSTSESVKNATQEAQNLAGEATATVKNLDDKTKDLLAKIQKLEKQFSYIKPVVIGSACTLTVVLGWIIYQVLYHSHDDVNGDEDGDDNYESEQAQLV